MKKSLFPRLALMAVVVALVSACSEKKFEYTNVIPANASTVVSINMKSLVDKAGLNDKENKRIVQTRISADNMLPLQPSTPNGETIFHTILIKM